MNISREDLSLKGIKKIKNPIMKVIFSRFFITFIMLASQAIVLLAAFFWMGRFSRLFMEACTVLSAIVIIWIINSRSNPAYKLSWAILVALLPVMGTMLYLYFHLSLGSIAPPRQLRATIAETADFTATSEDVLEKIADESMPFQKLSSYVEKIGGYPSWDNTEVKYYKLGDYVLGDICSELEKAEKFIFIEFFIIEEGLFWDKILEVLVEKADAGVEVRVMFDDMGCLTTLPRNYSKTLHSFGIRSKSFGRITPFLSTSYNNRDHRKLIVIDGETAISGGINLADEYLNKYIRFGEWKDNAFILKGDAVRNYTMMFLQMWNTSEKPSRHDVYQDYLQIESSRQPEKNDGYVIPYADGPHTQDNVAENVYLDIINSASEYIYIMTPYLIPDNEMLHSLKHAAKSGVDVRIITPGIPDKKMVNILTKSYYPELIRAGVKIFEYAPGFIHSKVMLADGIISAVGTINFDFRSLYLHYECASLLYKNPVITDITEDFEETFKSCELITLEEYRKLGVLFSGMASLLRVFAPLL